MHTLNVPLSVFRLKKHVEENHPRYVTSLVVAAIVILKLKLFEFKTTIAER